MPGIRIDGNDVIAVYHATRDALERARSGGGPTLLECRTYRWRGHVGPSWDMDVGVKRKDELQDWLPKDPIARLSSLLLQRGIDEAALAGIEDGIRTRVNDSVTFARHSPSPDDTDLLEHVFWSEAEVH